MNSSLTDAWNAVPLDPDPNADLDYEIEPLTILKTGPEADGNYMILPSESEHLTDEEFIVADAGSVCLLDECR